MPRGSPRISSVFLVVESSPTVRDSLCYALLSFGIKGVPAASRDEAREVLAHPQGIEGAIIDIDNTDVDGIRLVNDIKGDESLRGIAVIVHTVQSQKEFVRKMIEIGVAGYLLKPFSPETAKPKLEGILTKLSTHDSQRRHIRVTPDPDDLARVSFRVHPSPQLHSGRIVDISLGGMAIEMFNPPAEGQLATGVPLPRMDFALAGKALSPSGTVVLYKSRILAVRFDALGAADRQALEKYIFKRISS